MMLNGLDVFKVFISEYWGLILNYLLRTKYLLPIFEAQKNHLLEALKESIEYTNENMKVCSTLINVEDELKKNLLLSIKV